MSEFMSAEDFADLLVKQAVAVGIRPRTEWDLIVARIREAVHPDFVEQHLEQARQRHAGDEWPEIPALIRATERLFPEGPKA